MFEVTIYVLLYWAAGVAFMRYATFRSKIAVEDPVPFWIVAPLAWLPILVVVLTQYYLEKAEGK